MSKKGFFTVIAVAAFAIALFVLSAVLAKYVLLPLLPTHWQTDLAWIGSAVLATIGILAGLAELTGYSLKDFFGSETQPPLQQESTTGAVVLSGDMQGKIETGDIFQDDSTKIVVEQAYSPESLFKTDGVEKLIEDIQSSLYGDNSRLPYVLTLCLDLCERLALSGKYGEWIRRELTGYKDYEGFQNSFNNEDEFEDWMQRWATHRLVQPYIKFAYRSKESGRMVIDKLPLNEILIAFPVAEINRTIQGAREGGVQEIAYYLRDVDQRLFEKVQSTVAIVKPGVNIPSDLQLFYKVSDLERALDGIRGIVLLLLSEARSVVG
jgi:hypothetical protein